MATGKHAFIARMAFICAAAVLFSAWSPAGDIESYTLPNGLRVVLSRRPGAGIVSGRIAFRVGSGDERDRSEYGMAHLFEHLLFKSAPGRPMDALTRQIEDSGGYTNAATGNDTTTYMIDLPSEFLPLLLDIFADMVIAPAVTPEGLAGEKEVVVEEINQSNDNPDRALLDTFFDSLYGSDHPYAHPILGTAETVRGITLESVRAFHARHYRPDNASLVLSGDFDPGEAKKLVDASFAGWRKPAGKAPELPAAGRVAGDPVVDVAVNSRAALAKAYIGFRGPKAADADLAAASLLGQILGGDLSGRLIETVKKRDGLAIDIGAFVYPMRRDGLFAVAVEAEPEKLAPAVAAVLTELARLVDRPPTGDELDRGRARWRRALFASRDSAGGDANSLASFESLYGDWRLREAYNAFLSAVEPGDVVGAAARMYGSGSLTVAALLPESAADRAEDCARELQSLAAAFSPPSFEDADDGAPVFEERPFLDDVRLFVMRDPSRELVAVTAGAPNGVSLETADNNGIASMMASAWDKATETLDSTALPRAISDLGASIQSYSGSDAALLSGQFMRDNWREAMRLFVDILARPAFAPADIEESRREQLAAIAREDEWLPGRAKQLADELLYPGHPYALEMEGKAAVVANLTAEEVRDWYRRTVRSGPLTIAVAGNVEPEEVAGMLREALSGWRADRGAADSAVVARPEPPAGPMFAERTVDSAQTHIAYAFAAPAFGDPDRPAMHVLNAHLGGMGGVLFTELRERRKLAYTAQPMYSPKRLAGDLLLYISTENRKRGEALEGMRGIVEALRESGVSAEEVESAKRQLTGALVRARQTVDQLAFGAFNSVVKGYGADFDERYLERVAAVDADDVNRVIRTYLDPERMAIVVVGPEQAE